MDGGDRRFAVDGGEDGRRRLGVEVVTGRVDGTRRGARVIREMVAALRRRRRARNRIFF